MANVKYITAEIGSAIMRVCVPTVSKKHGSFGAGFGKRFMVGLPDGAVVGGIVKEPKVVGELLAEELKKHDITTKAVVFSVFSDRIAVKDATFPPVPASKVGQLVAANASDLFPMDLKDYKIAHFVIGGGAVKKAKTRVIICAAPVSVLDGYADAAGAAGLRLQSVDYAANSRFQAYTALNEGATLFADVDFDYTHLTFMRNDEILLQRTLPFGGGDLVGEYATAREWDVKSALRALSDSANNDDIESYIGADTAADYVDRIYTGVMRVFNVYESQNSDTPVERIVLSGPCAKLTGLRDSFSGAGRTTHIIDELPKVAELFPQVTSQEGAKFEYAYISTAAAAFAPVGLEPSNYARDEKRRKRAERQAKADNSLKSGVIVSALFVLLGFALVFTSWLNYTEAEDAKKRVEADIKALEYAKDAHDEYLTYRESAGHLIQLMNYTLATPNANLRAFFEELEAKMPREILLLSAACSATGASMNVTVPTKEDAARVISALRTFESLQSVSVKSLSEKEDVTGARYSFSVTCEYAGYAAETYAVGAGDSLEQDIENLNNFHYKQRSYEFENGGGGQ